MSQNTGINVYYLVWYAQSIRLKAYCDVLRHQAVAAQNSSPPSRPRTIGTTSTDIGTCCYHTLRLSLSCDFGVWVLETRVSCLRHIGRYAD